VKGGHCRSFRAGAALSFGGSRGTVVNNADSRSVAGLTLRPQKWSRRWPTGTR